MIQQKEYGGEKFLTLAFMCVLTNLNTPYEQATNNQIIHGNPIGTLNIPQRAFENSSFEEKASRNPVTFENHQQVWKAHQKSFPQAH